MKANLLLALVTTSFVGQVVAEPVYDVNEYALVATSGSEVSVSPYVGAGVGYGLSPDGIGYDVQLGISSSFPDGYSVDAGLYHSRLQGIGKKGDSISFSGGGSDVLAKSIPVKGYGIKTSFNFPLDLKNQLSVIVGAGFVYSEVETQASGKFKLEGAQISGGLGYGYRINENLTIGLSYEHYIRSAGMVMAEQWDVASATVKVYFK